MMKNLMFGLMAVGVALAGSAFTSASKNAVGEVYANTSNGSYTKVSNYNPDFCEQEETSPCSYRQISAGTIPEPMSQSQATDLVNSGVLTPSSNGIYNP